MIRRIVVWLTLGLLPAPSLALTDEAALELFNRARSGNTTAFDELRRAAEAGDAPAQFQLGRAYSHGASVQRDDATAARWVEKAAEQGHLEAQSNIGYLYSAALGVPRDPGKTMAWWTRAAEGGFVQAQFNLALAYLQGKLTAKDDAKGFAWMSKAAAQGSALAQSNLAELYRRGTGVAQDMSEAAAWYRKAAEQGNSTAAFNLALMYERGEGVARDAAESLQWARRAAARGNAAANALEARLCRDNTALCERNPAPPHFVFELNEPRLRIVIPDAPPMQMSPHPLAATTPHARVMGAGAGGYSISVLTPTSDARMTPLQCANSLDNALVRRYGLKPDAIVRRRNGESTYVMLFPVKADSALQLKAYLLSGHGGTHCVEVHLSKILASEKEIMPWFEGFAGARIEPY
jgi:TPR repeat protein